MNDRVIPPEGEERADHVSADELVELTADSAFYRHIRGKLLGRGAKLLSGPRGTGKTHQMRYVYLKCIKESGHPAAAYISFSRYARLEPMLRSSPDALKVFNSWMIAKIALGGAEFVRACQAASCDLLELSLDTTTDEVATYISEIENGDRLPSHDVIQTRLSMANLQRLFQVLLELSGRERLVLLLDDAALSLAPEYHAEFFSVFQDLKSPRVSPKASVYPGTTQYGPRFHARHDAEIVNAWLSVEDPDYLVVMNELLSKRAAVKPPQAEIAELFQYLAFGVPRTLLAMLRTYENVSQKANRTIQQNVNSVVQEQVWLQQVEFESLQYKLPQFKSVIAAGFHVFGAMVSAVASENQALIGGDEKQVIIGIQHADLSAMEVRMLNLLVEVGLLYPLRAVQHGEGREYDRYIPHFARLMSQRAFTAGRGFSAKSVVEVVRRKSTKHPVRRTLQRLLGPAYQNLRLDLAPCTNCGTARMDEAQRFCAHCGNRLPEPSRYRQMLALPISDLPIRDWQKTTIDRDTDVKTIGDLLSLQDPASELRRGSMIGKKRSASILEAVYTVVEEFLS